MSDRLREALEYWEGLMHVDSMPEGKFEPKPLAPVVAAARRFLALTETGRRIFWCEEHECNLPVTIEFAPDDGAKCIYREEIEFNDWVDQSKVADCRIVPKFLADYLTEEET